MYSIVDNSKYKAKEIMNTIKSQIFILVWNLIITRENYSWPFVVWPKMNLSPYNLNFKTPHSISWWFIELMLTILWRFTPNFSKNNSVNIKMINSFILNVLFICHLKKFKEYLQSTLGWYSWSWDLVDLFNFVILA